MTEVKAEGRVGLGLFEGDCAVVFAGTTCA